MNARRFLLVFLFAGVSIAAPRAQAPKAAFVVVNKEDATLAIVDVETHSVRARVPTGEGPHEVATSADGRTAFVSNYGGGSGGRTLSMIDVHAAKEIRRIDLGTLLRPHGLWVAGGKTYFTAEGSRRIGRYDPVANRVDWQFETGQDGTHMVLVNGDGSRVFTSNMGSNTISLIEQRGTEWAQTLVRVGAGPEGFDVSPDGRELWTAHTGDGRVSVIDLASRMVTHTLDVRTERSNRLKFTPDGRLVLISDLNGGVVVVVDAQTRREVKRLQLGATPEGILVAPHGTRAYVAVNGDDNVAVIDLKSLMVVDRIRTGRGPDGMAWATLN